MARILLVLIAALVTISVKAQSLTVVELNCENLFDTRHDSLKQDYEFLPEAVRRWTPYRYWQKQQAIAQTIMSCSSEGIPDMVALVEVENDTVLHDLTRRSLLRNAGYHYLMTDSPDQRGVDVALLYSPFSFQPICYDCLTVEPPAGMRPTRDILYVQGRVASGDTLHVFVVHAPSKFDGAKHTRAYRLQVAETILKRVEAIRSLSSLPLILIAGDLNETASEPMLLRLRQSGMHDLAVGAQGSHGARATYRYQGDWETIDHILVNTPLLQRHVSTAINDHPSLLEDDDKFGGVKPRRTFVGPRYHGGVSDHLPLVSRFTLK